MVFERIQVVIGLVVVLVAGSVAGGVAAGAQTAVGSPPPTTVLVAPTPDPSPRIRVLLGRLEVIAARTVFVDQQQAADLLHDDRAQAEAGVDGAMLAQTAAERRLSMARAQLSSTAVSAYVRPSTGDVSSVLEGDANAGAQEREFFAASMDRHQQQVVDAETAVESAESDADAAQRVLAAAQQAATDQEDEVAAASSGLAEARRELRSAVNDERRPLTAAPWPFTIEGPSAFTAEELARWYEAQGRGSRASVPVAELARSYVEQGEAEGIRGDMAFAQAIHETGWFANSDTITRNNFAGIGHCSACPGGIPFATAEIGVLAQIQLLKSYARFDPVYALPRADPGLDGPSGCCQTWSELTGVWASDPTYDDQILNDYAEMLVWLVAQRTAST